MQSTTTLMSKPRGTAGVVCPRVVIKRVKRL